MEVPFLIPDPCRDATNWMDELGTAAAQLGTAFMLCPEAGTVPAHRAAIRHGDARTALTRAFTGRTARGIVNR